MTGYPTERLRLRLNGQPVEIDIDRRTLLVEVIRDLGAKGTRIGCLTGDCGACSVELDGRVAKSCLVLAVSVDGSEIVNDRGKPGYHDRSGARGLQGAPRISMRVLHLRNDHGGRRTPAAQSEPDGSRDTSRH